MSEWIEHRLGEVCSRLSSGSNITAKDIHESGNFPVFGGNGIRGYAAEANFSGECAIIGRQGAYCGNVRYFIGEARMTEHAIVACAGPSHHTRFLAYLLSNMNLGSLSGQAAQPGLSVKVLAQQSVRMPSRQNQERIAVILGAYDDLIEVNRRRVAVLEEMARGLFEEWFVRFRFPGHESVPIVDTPDGPLPEGWRRCRLAHVADDVSYGFTAKAQHDGQGPKFLRITDIVDGPIHWQAVPHCEIDPKKLRRFALASEDIVVARTGATVGHARRVGMLASDAVYASYLVRFRFGAEYDPAIAAVFMQSDDYKTFVKTNAGGAAQPNANAKVLGSAIVAVPDAQTQARFVSLVRPMQDLIDLIVAHSSALATSRDLLLPRLISGQLSVAAAERELELAA